MLVLSRKVGQKIIINDNIEITVNEVKGDLVKIAISAPKEVKIYRQEVYIDIQAENKKAIKISKLPEIDLKKDSLNKNKNNSKSILD